MAKKKGAKGKLTPEQKKLRAQKKALKAEELRKKREAEQQLRLKQLQEREERYTQENLVEIHAEWRKILRVSRAKELREEIKNFIVEFDHQVNRRNSIISALFQDFDESEGKHHESFSRHLQVIDGFIDLHYVRTKDMEDEFQTHLTNLSNDFNNEKAEMMRSHERQKETLNDMMKAMERQFKDHEQELRHDYEATREEMKNRNLEEYNVLKISLESGIEELERRLEDTHEGYLSNTETKTQAFKKMIDKDKVSARLIEQRMRKLIFIHDNIAYWKAKISSSSREWDTINKALRDQKDYVNGHYQALKKKLLRFKNGEHVKLKEISKTSEEINTELSAYLKLSERIMRFGEVNHKLETEHERTFPFDPLHCKTVLMPDLVEQSGPDDHTGDDSQVKKKKKKKSVTISERPAKIMFKLEEKKAEKYKASAYSTDEKGAEVEEWNYLHLFQKRYNKVLLDKLALEMEKKRVMAENKQLQSAVQQYLDGITVNENVLKGPMNTLLMITPFKAAA